MKSFTLHVNDASGSVQVVKLHHDGSLHDADRIRVPKHSKIQLIDDETQLAPDNVRVERVGNDLHVAFPGTNIASPDLILEDFYTSDGGFASLVGQAENGMIYNYVPESGATAEYVGNIASSVVSGQVLGGSSVSAFYVAAPLAAEGGAGEWAFAALAVGAAAVGTALALGAGDNHGTALPVGPNANGRLAPDSDSGIKGDNLTNDNTPTIIGSGTAGDKITVTLPTGEVLQTTIAADGTWSVTPTHALPDGANTITIVETNPAGVSGTPASLVLTIDTTAPTAPTANLTHDAADDTGSSSTDSITSNNKPSLSGTGAAGTTITVTVDGSSSYTTTVASNGTWTVPTTSTLADGTHTLSVTSTDAAGNVTSGTTIPFVVDTTAPAAPTGGVTHDAADDTGTSATDSLTSNSKPTLSGTGEPGSTIAVVVGGVGGGTYTATVDANGNWTVATTSALGDGTHPVTITSTDAAGNATTAAGTPIVVDTTAPSVPTANLTHDAADDTGTSATDSITSNNKPSLSGTGEAGTTITVTVDGSTSYTTTVGSNGTWTVPTTSTLADGTHTLSVTSTDAAGNTTTGTTTPFTVDTTAPVAPTANLTHDAADDTGSSSTDSITSNNKPSLSGTAEPNSTVTVVVAGTGGGTYTTTADANGNWTVATTSALGDGTHPVTVTSTDAAGNATTAAGTPFVVNTTAPTAPTANLTHDAADDTGSSSTDSITSNNKPSLSGTGAAGTTITVTVDGSSSYTTTVASNGTWTVPTTSTLADGTHTLSVTSTDAAGNVTSGTTIPFVVDTTAPAAPTGGVTHDAADDTGTSATDSLTSNSKPTLSGTGEPGSTIAVVVGGVGGGTYTATVDANGNWTVATTSALGDGTHPVTITSTDAAGNATTAAGTPIVVDTTAPSVPTANLTHDAADDTGTSATDSITSNNKPSLSGTGEAGTTITVTVDGSTSYTTTVGSNGTWTVPTTSTLADGTHTLSVTSTDAAGNTTTGTTTPFTVDTTAPVAPTANLTHDAADDTGSSSTDSITSNNKPSLSGTAEPNSTVTVVVAGTGGGTYTTTADANGNWTVATTSALGDGTHPVTVTSTDAAGNATTAAGTPFVVNTTAPTAPTANLTHDAADDTGSSSTDSITSNNKPSLSGTGAAGTTITVTVDGSSSYTTTVASNGTWTVPTTSTLADGTHTLSVTSTDAAGNVTSGTTIPFVVDTTAPAAPTGGVTHDAADDTGTSATDSLTSNSKPTLSGTGEPGSTIAVVVGGVGGGTYTATVDANGNWTVATTSALGDGTHPVTITSTDAAGNATTAAGTPIVVDTTAPSVPTANLTHDAADDTGTSATDSITSNNKPSLSGTGEAGTTITVTVDGSTSYTTTVGSNGTWTVPTTSTLADGTHTLSVTSTDAAGNTTTGTTTPFTVDTTAPVAPTANLTHDAADDTGSSSTDSITSNNKPSLSGTAEPNSTVTVVVAGTGGGTYTTTADANGNWTVATTSALGDGTHPVTVTSTDAAGNATTAAGTPFVVNTTAPTAPTANLTHDAADDTGSSSTDSITSNNKPSLSGTGAAGTTITVTVDGSSSYTTTVASNGTWTVPTTSTLADGTHTLSVTSTDAAGNVTSGTTIPFVVDTTAPAAPTGGVTHDAADDTGTSATDSLTSNSKPTLSGTGEPGSTIAVVVGGVGGGTYTATVDANGNWTVATTSALGDGTHPVTITSTDAAGNATTAAGTPIVVDTTAPSVPTANLTHDAADDTGTSATDSITSNNKPSLSGTGEAGTTITVTVDGSTSYTTTVGSNGTWTVPTTSTLADGTHTLSVTSTDAAGNTTTGTTTPFTVDTTAPVAPTANLTHDAADDTGSSSTDSITSNNKPSLSGTAEPNSTVTVVVAGTGGGTYTTTADANGNWTVATTSALGDGTHPVTVTSTDAAGNATTAAGTPFVVNTTAPTAPTANLTHDAADDTGSSSTDSITSNNKPSLSGTGAAGTTITVTVDGSSSYTTTVASNGTWTVPTTSTLADGTHTLSVTSTDAAGNVTSGTTIPFVVDTTAPAAPTGGVTHDAADDTGTSATDSLTSNSKPTLSGTGEPGSTIAVVVGGVGGGTYTATVDANGNWTVATTSALGDGTHPVTITSTDAAGNATTAAGTPIVVDTTAPSVPTANLTHDAADDTGTSATDSITSNNKPSLSGTGEAGTTITVTVDGSTSYTTTVGSNGTWTVPTTSTLADGTHTLSVTSTDAAGNTTTGTTTPFTVDTTAPVAPTANLTHDAADDTGSSSTDSITSNNKPSLSGTAEPNSTVTVVVAGTGGGTYTTTADANGNWTVATTSALGDGTHPVTVTSTDAAGNATTAAGTPFVVNTTAPTAPTANLTHDAADDTGSSSTDSITSNNKPSLSGTGAAGTTITVTVDGSSSYTTTVASNGTWTVPTTSTLADGTHTLSVTSTDAAGNVTSGTTIPFVVDTTAPAAPTGGVTHDAADDTGTSATDSLTSNSKPTLSGTGEPGSTIAVVVGGVGGGTYTATVDANGNWTVATTSALGDGTHPVTITSTDAAGNATTAAGTPIVVDTTAPSVPTANLTHDAADDTGTSATDSITSNNKPSLSGTGEAGTTITVTVDGSTSYTTTVGSNGTWTVPTTSTLADGTHTLSVTSTDAAGNTTTGTTTPFTVDTTAPVAPTANLTHDAADDTGSSSTDSITSNNKPSLSGTAEPNSTVTVVVAGTGGGTYTTTADANGNWTVATTSALGDGTHPVTVTSTDAAGNATTAAGTPFVVNTTAPTAPTANLTHDAADDTGSSSTDSITSNNKPSLSGTGAAGTTITVTVDGSSSYTTTVASNGTWTVPTTSTLADGTHTLSVTSTDAAGNVTSGTTIPFVVDTTAPAAPTGGVTHDAADDTGTSATDSLTSNSKPTLSGTGEPGSTIAVVVGGVGGGTYTATVDANGNWTVATTSALGDGTHPVTITSTDAAGNATTAAGTPIVVDTTAPSVPTANLTHDAADDTGTSATDSITSNNKPSLSGTGEAGTTITVTVDGSTSYTTTVGSNGTWTVPTTSTLADGTHTLSVTSTDAAGNTTTGTTTPFTVDTTAPVAPTANLTHDAADDTGSSSTDSITSNNKPSLSGTAEPNSTVTVVVAGTGGGTYTTTADANGNWTVATTSALGDGTHPVTVTSTDAAGNATTAAGTPFVVNTTAPTAPTANLTHDAADDTGSSSTDSITSNNKPSLSGTGAAGTTITVTVDGSSSYTTTVASNGTWTVPTTSTLADGTHTLSVTSTDAAGNVTSGTTIPFVVDTTAPAAPTGGVTHDAADDTGTSATDSLTSNSKPTLSGTGEPGSTIAVVVGGVGGGTYTATVDANGNWTVATTSALGDGTHPVTITSTDAAGNATTAAGTPIVVDTTAPSVPTANLTHDAADDTGTSATDSITSNNKPSLSGTGEAGTTITVTVDGSTSYTTTVGSNGTWTVPTTSTLADGTHTLSVTSTDAAGNTTTGTTTPFTVDTTAPTLDLDGNNSHNSVTTTTPIAGLYNTGVNSGGTGAGAGGGTLAAGTTDSHWTVEAPGATTFTAAPVTTPNPNWQANDSTSAWLGNGTTVAANGSAGGQFQYQTSFTLPTGADPKSVLINFGIESDNYVTDILVNGVSTGIHDNLANAGGNYTGLTNVSLSGASGLFNSGVNTITIVTYNGSSPTNPQQGAEGIRIDNLTSSVAVVTGTNASNATGYAADYVERSAPIAIADADTTITDTNNIAGATITLTNAQASDLLAVNGTLPSGITASSYNATTGVLTLTGTASAAAYQTAIEDLTFSNSSYTPSSTQRTINISVTDVAGNTSNLAPSIITVVPVPPAYQGALTQTAANDTGTLGDNITSNQTPTLSGTTDPGATVSFTINGTTYSTTADPTTGAWSIKVTNALADGNYDPLITVTNGATSNSGYATPFTIDHTAPTIAAQTFSYAEGSAAGSALGTVAATDNNAVTKYYFTSSGGTTSSDGLYTINATTGAITLVAAAPYYQASTASHVESVTVADVAGNTSAANITLNETDVAPTATPAKETGVSNAPLTLTLAAFGGSDVSGSTLSYKITSLPVNGTLTDNGTAVTVNQVISSADISSGKLIFTPATGESGYPGYNSTGVGNGKNDYAAIGYQVSDGTVSSATNTLLLDIAPLPTINGATALQIFTNFNGAITGQYAGSGFEYAAPPSPWLSSNQAAAANNNTAGTVEIGQSTLYGITGPVSNVLQVAELGSTANNFYTTFNTVAGQTYVLTFDYASEADNVQGGDTANMSKITVLYGTAASALGTGTTVGTYTGTGTTPGFTHETITLTGTGSTMRVEFDAPTGDQNGGLIDNIGLNTTTNTGGVGTTIPLFKLTPALVDTDGSETITSVTLAGITVGDTLSDGANTFTATTGNTTATVTNWNLSSLTYVGATAETVNLTATVTATETASGASDSASSTYTVIVAPAITGPTGNTGTAAATIVGTGVNDTIYADRGTDTLTGNGGNNNHFVFAAGTGANKPTDTITDFSLASGPGDVIDLKGLLSGATGTVTTANIGNYLQLTNSGTTEILKVNLSGTGMTTGFGTPDLTINLTAATTHGVPATETLAQLIASHNLIIM